MYTNIDKNSTIIPLYMEAVIKTMNFCLEFLNAKHIYWKYSCAKDVSDKMGILQLHQNV